jgi:curved DNA-binding protein CbpA
VDRMVWLIYAAAVLVVSGLVGLHLGRFREAYTEMTGMMAGMTMGMLNGFVLGYCAAAAANSMFWGNLFGILLGLLLGTYFGRAGGLMGIMDGGMGGVMGGAMGAMLAVMVVFPREGLFWTAVLLGLVYIAGTAGLVALIEQSAPGHAALHRLLPMFTRAVAREVEEEAEGERYAASSLHNTPARSNDGRRLVDYYRLLGVPRDAGQDEITGAYFAKIEGLDVDVDSGEDHASIQRMERALSVLTDVHKRSAYDRKLRESEMAWAASVPALSSGAEAMVRMTSQDTGLPVSEPPKVPLAGKSTGDSGGNNTGRPNRPPGSGASGQAGKGQAARQAQQSQQPQASKNGKGNAQSRRGDGNRAPQKQARVESRQHAQPAGRNSVVSARWAGGLVFLVILAAVGWWAISAGTARTAGSASGATSARHSPNAVVGASGETQSQLEQQAVAAQMGTDGKQTVDVVLNSATFQYEPKVIKVKQGAPVRFNLSVINGDPG